MLKLNNTYNESCLDTLGRIPDNYLDCVVTSPPYWGLRDYGLQPSIWDAQDGCLHEWGNETKKWHSGTNAGEKQLTSGGAFHNNHSSIYGFCTKCSAWRGNLGLEPTPELYVQHMVTIFSEIKRALKPEGTVWLNLGDTFSSSPSNQKQSHGVRAPAFKNMKRLNRNTSGLRPKNLVGVPWRVAFALQADGWYLRSDIIWAKPNPMPESVTDRPTKSHEYIFLLTKSAKYYYDADAIRENGATSKDSKAGHTFGGKKNDTAYKAKSNRPGKKWDWSETRNKRTVWTVTTKPFKEAHFATYPPDLIRPCILAGCPVGGIVYDPFMGSGTTAEVAILNNRKYLGSELNPEYIKLSEKRLGLFK